MIPKLLAQSAIAGLLALLMALPRPAMASTASSPTKTRARPMLMGSMEAMPPMHRVPQMKKVRVQRSNYRRVLWGQALTLTGIVGILAGAAGMILYSSNVDKDKGPSALANPSLARSYRRKQRGGLALLFSGLGVGVAGLLSGPLLMRSGRKRQHEAWSQKRVIGPAFSGHHAWLPVDPF